MFLFPLFVRIQERKEIEMKALNVIRNIWNSFSNCFSFYLTPTLWSVNDRKGFGVHFFAIIIQNASTFFEFSLTVLNINMVALFRKKVK